MANSTELVLALTISDLATPTPTLFPLASALGSMFDSSVMTSTEETKSDPSPLGSKLGRTYPSLHAIPYVNRRSLQNHAINVYYNNEKYNLPKCLVDQFCCYVFVVRTLGFGIQCQVSFAPTIDEAERYGDD